jgi:hypothetical protein
VLGEAWRRGAAPWPTGAGAAKMPGSGGG